MIRSKVAGVVLGVGLLLAFSPGCGPAQLTDLEVSNANNAFGLTVVLADASGSREDLWAVSGDRVWVDWSGTALEEGSVSLELTSPDALRAYRESALVGAPPTAAASVVSTAGEWTVQLTWSGATGPLQLSLTGVQ